MKAYADLSYYHTVYQGASISEASFDALAIRASWYIDGLIGRHLDAPMEAVKMACCAVADVMNMQDEIAMKQSESVGQYSVSYQSPVEHKTQLYEAAASYLRNTGLMYRGVKIGC